MLLETIMQRFISKRIDGQITILVCSGLRNTFNLLLKKLLEHRSGGFLSTMAMRYILQPALYNSAFDTISLCFIFLYIQHIFYNLWTLNSLGHYRLHIRRVSKQGLDFKDSTRLTRLNF